MRMVKKNLHLCIADKRRALLKREALPGGSKSPLQFDLYTLNHAAKVR